LRNLEDGNNVHKTGNFFDDVVIISKDEAKVTAHRDLNQR